MGVVTTNGCGFATGEVRVQFPRAHALSADTLAWQVWLKGDQLVLSSVSQLKGSVLQAVIQGGEKLTLEAEVSENLR